MKFLKKLKSIHDFKNDPFGFIIDSIVIIVVNLLVPIPMSGKIAAQFRGPVLGCLISFLVLGLFILTVLGTILMTPLLITSGFLKTFTLGSGASLSADNGFDEASIPHQNPFGGQGMDFCTVSAYFMDSGYYLFFGKNHTGVDLVPSNSYFTNSNAFKTTREIIIFSTINGRVNYYTDSEGGETVEVTNSDNSLKVIFIHFSEVLVNTGNIIKAGTPIGIIGSTGFSTGAHVHYEIRIKNGSSWLAVNPLNYIQ